MSYFLNFALLLSFVFISTASIAQSNQQDNLLTYIHTDKEWVLQSSDNSSNLMIDFQALRSMPYKIHIFSEDGMLVYADDLVFIPSTAIYSVEIEDLKKGRYLLSVSGLGNEVYSHHFTKE